MLVKQAIKVIMWRVDKIKHCVRNTELVFTMKGETGNEMKCTESKLRDLFGSNDLKANFCTPDAFCHTQAQLNM